MKKQTLQELIEERNKHFKEKSDVVARIIRGELSSVGYPAQEILINFSEETTQKILQWIVDKMPQKRCLHELTELHNEGTSGSQTCISCNKYFKNKEAKEIDISENYGHNECLNKILSPIKSVLNKK